MATALLAPPAAPGELLKEESEVSCSELPSLQASPALQSTSVPRSVSTPELMAEPVQPRSDAIPRLPLDDVFIQVRDLVSGPDAALSDGTP